MSFTRQSHIAISPPIPGRSGTSPVRPKFNSFRTCDRLREGTGLQPRPFLMANKLRKDRKSVFKEVGLDDDFSDEGSPTSPMQNREYSRTSSIGNENKPEAESRESREQGSNTSREEDRASGPDEQEQTLNQQRSQEETRPSRPWYAKLSPMNRRPRIKTASSAPPPTVSSLQRFAMIALLIAVIFPAFSYNNGRQTTQINGADAGVISPRDMSPIDVCTRWSHQVALLNGTLYMYGGQAKTTSDQTTNTWNNNFLTLDLTKSWDISSPALSGLPVPSGPPAVASGYLWNDYNNLYLYGGEFADNQGGAGQYAAPAPLGTWQYSVKSQTWTEFSNPVTSAGNYSEPSGVPVQRAAEGAGLSVPELGLSWYFGGHLDLATTPGWSNQIARVYLKSLLEFTHPGYTNNGVYSLAGGTGAGSGGAYRNITQGGVQANEFPERADGALVYVPGWGASGVLIGLAGGNADTFTRDLSILDVYDIATSEWYHQKTSGSPPSVRVNPCVVVASAPDASSFQIYMFGGQNLQPYKEQIQYNDMYILSIPAFTWIQVSNSGQSIPAPRAGHTCTMRDSQIVVVGGFVGNSIPCDSPGIYIFDASTLKWKNRFDAADHAANLSPDNSIAAGSYGYQVPAAVQSAIGGSSAGGATATTPAAGPATGGPFATGKPPVYTITRSGQTATITQWGTQTGAAMPTAGTSGSGSGSAKTTGPNGGLIAAGVIAGCLGLLAGYLGFCAWLYKRRVQVYREHVAARLQGASSSDLNAQSGVVAAMWSRNKRRHESSGTTAQESFAWVGRSPEPKWSYDDPTPVSDHTGGSSSGSGVPYYQPGEDQRAEYAYLADGQGRDTDAGSLSSTEQLLHGHEPSFFSVVLAPRRALRVVNGAD